MRQGVGYGGQQETRHVYSRDFDIFTTTTVAIEFRAPDQTWIIDPSASLTHRPRSSLALEIGAF
jgi:hypothetical protein